MNIHANYFELFGLPARFTLDAAALDSSYRDLQNRVHPDKFASDGDAEKRVALQWATRANEAYRTLRSPLKRAAYLCELGGADVHGRTNVPTSAEFLSQQMEWREALGDARASGNVAILGQIERDWKEARSILLRRIGHLIDQAKDVDKAAESVRQLMFLEKFGDEIAAAVESTEV